MSFVAFALSTKKPFTLHHLTLFGVFTSINHYDNIQFIALTEIPFKIGVVDMMLFLKT